MLGRVSSPSFTQVGTPAGTSVCEAACHCPATGDGLSGLMGTRRGPQKKDFTSLFVSAEVHVVHMSCAAGCKVPGSLPDFDQFEDVIT